MKWLVAVHHRDGNIIFEFPTKKDANIFRSIVEKDGYPTLVAKA